MNKIKFNLASAGYCEALKSHALRKEPNQIIKFYATYAHIEHPIHGHILFDTGYTERFYKYTRTYPFKLYARITKVYIDEKEEAKNLLKKKGVDPNDIKFIIVSHFHADHICGLSDFPNAKFICSKIAYEDIKNRKGFRALKRGFIPNLMPKDFESRALFLSFDSSDHSLEHLGTAIDLFDDQSIMIIDLGGHAKGQIGALLNTPKKTLLVSDAAWLRENYERYQLPSPIVRVFFDSWKDYKKNLYKIHTYHKANPNTEIIPCHCEQTLKEMT